MAPHGNAPTSILLCLGMQSRSSAPFQLRHNCSILMEAVSLRLGSAGMNTCAFQLKVVCVGGSTRVFKKINVFATTQILSYKQGRISQPWGQRRDMKHQRHKGSICVPEYIDYKTTQTRRFLRSQCAAPCSSWAQTNNPFFLFVLWIHLTWKLQQINCFPANWKETIIKITSYWSIHRNTGGGGGSSVGRPTDRTKRSERPVLLWGLQCDNLLIEAEKASIPDKPPNNVRNQPVVLTQKKKNTQQNQFSHISHHFIQSIHYSFQRIKYPFDAYFLLFLHFFLFTCCSKIQIFLTCCLVLIGVICIHIQITKTKED